MRTVALDFETSGLDYYAPEFVVTDLALSWRDDSNQMRSVHIAGQHTIGEALRSLAKKQVRIVYHNAQFDHGVLTAQYPGVVFEDWYDTMRLCQVGDAGQQQMMYETRYLNQKGTPTDGLSLMACASRWLDAEYHDHKRPFYKYLVDSCGVTPGTEGANLQKLTPELLSQYNCADTETTLRIYEQVIAQFAKDSYTGYEPDHFMYRGRIKHLINAFLSGVQVDVAKLQDCIDRTSSELDNIWRQFYEIHKKDILKCIAIKIKAYCENPSLKTDKAREARWMKIATGEDFGDREKICGFNVNGKDLLLLYRDVLGIDPPFYTLPNKKTGSAGGSPSFKKAHLPAWHKESGQVLSNKGTLRIVKSQAESLQSLSRSDGRYHLEMLATGTKTGRLSGSSNDGS